jgi:DNA adenine methylase
MLKPPIGRIGGKSRSAEYVISLFPKHSIYVEPFVGAGNIIYRKPRSSVEVINDLDKDMYNIFKGIQKSGKRINQIIPREYLTKEQYMHIRDKKDIISLLLNYHNSWGSRGRHLNERGQEGKLGNWRADFEALQNRLKGVEIYNRDFRDVINHFDSPSTFFYLDPPYEGSNDYGHGRIAVEDVYNAVKKIRGKFLLSYNDSPNIRRIFKGYHFRNIPVVYSANSNTGERSAINELLISNY